MSVADAGVSTFGDKSVGCLPDNTAVAPEECDAITTDNVYPDPLYNANFWAFDLINVEAVWNMGISTYTKQSCG